MMAHGKLASPYIYGCRAHQAPASKARQVAGAGERANSRRGNVNGNKQSAHEHNNERAQERTKAREAWHATVKQQNTRNDALAQMMRYAQDLATQADAAEGAHKLALIWMAQGIAAEVARKEAARLGGN